LSEGIFGNPIDKHNNSSTTCSLDQINTQARTRKWVSPTKSFAQKHSCQKGQTNVKTFQPNNVGSIAENVDALLHTA
jgi:hypothetical protein